MKELFRCEKIIEKIVESGGQILEEITEKNNEVSVHKIILQLNKIFFKLSFVNTPTKQLDVVKLFKFGVEEDWHEWDEKLLNL